MECLNMSKNIWAMPKHVLTFLLLNYWWLSYESYCLFIDVMCTWWPFEKIFYLCSALSLVHWNNCVFTAKFTTVLLSVHLWYPDLPWYWMHSTTRDLVSTINHCHFETKTSSNTCGSSHQMFLQYLWNSIYTSTVLVQTLPTLDHVHQMENTKCNMLFSCVWKWNTLRICGGIMWCTKGCVYKMMSVDDLHEKTCTI